MFLEHDFPLRARLARAAADIVQRMPRSMTAPLAWGLGGLLMLSYGRQDALGSLARAYPDWSSGRRWRVAAASYRRMARSLIEFLQTHDYSGTELRRRVGLENEDAFAAAHAGGQGIVLLSGHYGNWEWLAARIVAQGYPFAVLYKAPRDAGLGARLRETREAAGIVQIDHDDMRAAIDWLRQGGVLGIVMDQEPRRAREGVVASLFGRPTMTHVVPFRLARRMRVPVFTSFIREDGRHYSARLEPFPLSDDPDPERAVAADAAAFNARLEAEIRRAPEGWMWMYPRWKRLSRRAEEAAQSPQAARSSANSSPGVQAGGSGDSATA